MTTYHLNSPQTRHNALQAIQNAPEGCEVTLREPKRTDAQNRLLWPLLESFAAQLQWPVNGEMTYLTAADWKDLLSAAYRKASPRVALGVDGGMVLLGQRTSKMRKDEFSEFIEFIRHVAADRGVLL